MKYAKYKDSGVEWLGQIPENWQPKRLKFITSKIVDGTHFTPDYIEEGIPFLRVTDITKGRINFDTTKRISEDEHNELTLRCKPEKGDLLLSKNGTIGVPYIVDWEEPFSIFVSLCLIKPKSIVNTNFLKFIFLSKEIEEQISASGKTNTITNLHLDKIKEFFLALPSIKEQESIVSYLETETTRIDELIVKKQAFIETLKEKRISIISKAVTKGLDSDSKLKDSGIDWLGNIPENWNMKRLKFVVRLINNKIEISDNVDDEKLKYIGLENIVPFKGKIEPTDEFYVPEGISNSFKTNDVLFGKLRPYLAKAFIAQFNGICSSELLVLRPNNLIDKEFLLCVMLSDGFLETVNSSTYGSKMPRASWNFIGSIPIPLPKVEEQTRIVNYLKTELDFIDKTVDKTELAVQKLKEYKTALISSVVTGKLKVTE
nr:restriction endonuclease subunit S [uncultured Carboxylicivirga sp.]